MIAIPVTGSASRTSVTMTWLRKTEARPSVAAFLSTARPAFENLVPGSPKILDVPDQVA
ncbi:hypothetical protein GCM10023080_065620 [Streptomyces pseudoechinosporeus]